MNFAAIIIETIDNLRSLSNAVDEVILTQKAQRELHIKEGRNDLRIAARAAHDAELKAAGVAEGALGKIKVMRKKRLNDPDFTSHGF